MFRKSYLVSTFGVMLVLVAACDTRNNNDLYSQAKAAAAQEEAKKSGATSVSSAPKKKADKPVPTAPTAPAAPTAPTAPAAPTAPDVMPKKVTSAKDIPGGVLLCRTARGEMADVSSPVAEIDKEAVIAVNDGKAYVYHNFRKDKDQYGQVLVLDLNGPVETKNAMAKLSATKKESKLVQQESKTIDVTWNLVLDGYGLMKLDRSVTIYMYEGPGEDRGTKTLLETDNCETMLDGAK